MKKKNLHALPAQPGRKEDARELCVVFACHHLICAIPARSVERLVLPEEVGIIPRSRSIDGGWFEETAGGPGWRIVQVGEQAYAACNLGTQLGLAPVDTAWALLRVWHRGVELPVALQTGPCLVVQPLGAGTELPDGAFRERPGAVVSAFPTTLLSSESEHIEVGLRLDPDRMWTESELDAAETMLTEYRGEE